ncbi:hypothetical protein [Armatimonas sp.]|uniref:hypothetical protein n=1 Tax=Armatimonas sp. TaxID=1872638 RepID=UPI00375254E8
MLDALALMVLENQKLHHKPKAKRVVQLFMSGAASQCDTFLIDQSERFAKRLAALPKERQVAEAFRLALGRSPSIMEQTDALAYVQKNGLENLCRLLFNTSEFVFVD